MKPFMTINQASEASGLSAFYIRHGVKSGFIPSVKCGNKYLINYQKFIEKMDKATSETTFDIEKAFSKNTDKLPE